jgi:hypothetical protein
MILKLIWNILYILGHARAVLSNVSQFLFNLRLSLKLTQGSVPGGKADAAWSWTPSRAEVKNEWSYASAPLYTKGRSMSARQERHSCLTRNGLLRYR